MLLHEYLSASFFLFRTFWVFYFLETWNHLAWNVKAITCHGSMNVQNMSCKTKTFAFSTLPSSVVIQIQFEFSQSCAHSFLSFLSNRQDNDTELAL